MRSQKLRKASTCKAIRSCRKFRRFCCPSSATSLMIVSPTCLRSSKKKADAAFKGATALLKEAKAKLAKEEPTPYAAAVIDSFPADAKGWQEACTLLASQLSAIKRAAKKK